jgi:hypothetical protein
MNRLFLYRAIWIWGKIYNLGPRLGIGAEYQMRKLFSDKLDNVDDPLSFITLEKRLNIQLLA